MDIQLYSEAKQALKSKGVPVLLLDDKQAIEKKIEELTDGRIPNMRDAFADFREERDDAIRSCSEMRGIKYKERKATDLKTILHTAIFLDPDGPEAAELGIGKFFAIDYGDIDGLECFRTGGSILYRNSQDERLDQAYTWLSQQSPLVEYYNRMQEHPLRIQNGIPVLADPKFNFAR